jgi:hypothetical protein
MKGGALTVASYPHDPIKIACRKCGRSGRYKRSTLVEMFGADQVMPEVLSRLAACDKRGNASDPCQVIFPDLARKPKPVGLSDR